MEGEARNRTDKIRHLANPGQAQASEVSRFSCFPESRAASQSDRSNTTLCEFQASKVPRFWWFPAENSAFAREARKTALRVMAI